jgi:hypothetical protein
VGKLVVFAEDQIVGWSVQGSLGIKTKINQDTEAV